MSWQRIFELSRRQKSPLIITDIAGREPLVVLPLDAYERLLDRSPEPSVAAISVPVRSDAPSADSASSVSSRSPQSVEPPSLDDKIVLEEIAQVPPTAYADSMPSASHAAISATPEAAMETDDLLLEEKFYLEPLDEGGK